MNTERWNRIEGLFLQAVELDSEARSAWLDRECGSDADLRAQVDRLLISDTGAASALSGVVGTSVKALDAPRDTPMERIGPYEILSEIGRGGMGVVYLARRDDVFRKQVAIKVVKRGMDTDQILTRFLHERRILARLEHPSIARIIDGGTTDGGLPYLVMEYVEGLPLTDYCEQHRLGLKERLELFCKVCAAVDYAHQSLVVHRDLKPSNILVDSSGTPKLLDFGIAKLLAPDEGDPSTLTLDGMHLLTPQYASPEQISGEPITTASDVYSLGAILYELLTGSLAHQITSYTPASLLRAICETEVVMPSKAAKAAKRPPVATSDLAGDLDNILSMALRKDRHERYRSVHLLGEDLQRYLASRPVLARPQTLRYRTAKFLRRNRVPVIAASLAAASMIGGTAFSIYQARRAERRFDEVRTLAKAVLFDIHDQVETLPGSTNARELMVRTVLRYLNNLARESSGDRSLQWELATAYQKIGDVQGYGVRPNLGHSKEAMESHRKALKIAEELAAGSNDPNVMRLLAVAYHRVGFLSGTLSDGVGAGLEYYQRSLDVLEKLNRESPGQPDNSRLLIMVYGHRGDAELLLGRPVQAAVSWRRTVGIAEQWVNRNPSDAAKVALGNAHRRVSRSEQLTGNLPGALEHARQAIAIHEPLAAAQTASTAMQREILNSYERLAFALADPEYLSAGDRATAFVYNQKVLAIAESLSQADPSNIMAASDLVIARRSVCTFMPDDDLQSLLRACQDSVDAAKRFGRGFAEVEPSDALRVAPALWKLGRRADALKVIERATELLNDAIAKLGWRADLQRQLARTHNLFGTLLREAGKPADALRQHQKALAIGQQVLASNPEDLATIRDLGDTYASLGAYYEGRDWFQAEQWYKKNLEIWTDWPRRAPSGVLDQSRREEAVRNIARCAQHRANGA